MGKQVRFYMLPEDEKNFLDFVLMRPSVKLLRPISETTDFILDDGNFQWLSQVYIWDSIFWLDPNKIHPKFRRYFDENLAIFIDTEEKYYKLDISDQPLIVYSRSLLRDDGKLKQGRIWVDMYRLEANQLVPEEPEFVAWYDEIANWLRRHLKRDKQLDAYVSQGAMEWHQHGGEFH
jgi:hypothetical protein